MYTTKSRLKNGFGAVDFETAPSSQSSKYSIFVNKLFSNVPRVIKKYMLSLIRAIIYLQGVSGFRSRPPPGFGSETPVKIRLSEWICT